MALGLAFVTEDPSADRPQSRRQRSQQYMPCQPSRDESAFFNESACGIGRQQGDDRAFQDQVAHDTMAVSGLSGGNQQKACSENGSCESHAFCCSMNPLAVSMWVQNRNLSHHLRFCQGGTVVMVSSEIDEVLGMSGPHHGHAWRTIGRHLPQGGNGRAVIGASFDMKAAGENIAFRS